jgi:uncharacterized membrane protein YwzB
MKIEKNSWHAHLFFECLKMCEAFTDRDWLVEQYRRRTNLCHYMRVVMVYAPLIIAVHVVAVVATFWVLIIRPIQLFGMTGYLSTLRVIVIGIVTIVLLVGLRALILHFYRKRKPRDVVHHEPGKLAQSLDLFGEYLAAKKARICPLITFKGDANV